MFMKKVRKTAMFCRRQIFFIAHCKYNLRFKNFSGVSYGKPSLDFDNE